MSTNRSRTQCKAYISTTVTKRQVEIMSEDKLEVFGLEEHCENPCVIQVKVGTTRNLGNFESLRTDISLSVPVSPENLEEKFSQAAEWVYNKLAEEEDKYLEGDEE